MKDTQKAVEKIMQAKGRQVRFQYRYAGRRPQEEAEGILKERSVTAISKRYFAVVDLIEFDGGKWMRFGYYVWSGRRLTWASRSAPTFSLKEWKAIFGEAKSRDWFVAMMATVGMNRKSTHS